MKLSNKLIILALLIAILAAIALWIEPKYVSDWKRANNYMVD